MLDCMLGDAYHRDDVSPCFPDDFNRIFHSDILDDDVFLRNLHQRRVERDVAYGLLNMRPDHEQTVDWYDPQSCSLFNVSAL